MDLLHIIAVTLITLGILVTIHEWGHFYVARRCGVKVLRFSVGFGKPLVSWRDKHNTEYVIAAIPLGGYVKMLDERETEVPADQLHLSFNRKPVWQRIAIVAAGPLVNLIFAVFAYWVMYGYGVSSVAPVVGAVTEGKPVAAVSIPVPGEIVSVDGYKTATWDDVNLRLASRVGESGSIHLQLRADDASLVESFIIPISSWAVDVDKESPVSALGLVPWRPHQPAVVAELVEEGRALQAGLQRGDEIFSVDGEVIADWISFVREVQARPEQVLNLVVLRGEQRLNIELRPEGKLDEKGQAYGFVGIGPKPVDWPEKYKRTVQYDLFNAIGKAFEKSWQMIVLTLESIWKMIEGVISVKNLSGPITIAKVAGAQASAGFEYYIGFLAYLSISLGVLNLLPIPVLDGGHLLYYFTELVTGRPVSERIQLIGLKFGMAILFSLMFLALFNDFMRL